MERAVILLCPVCSTQVDEEVDGDQSVECECPSCETSFTVKVVLEKIAKHSLYG